MRREKELPLSSKKRVRARARSRKSEVHAKERWVPGRRGKTSRKSFIGARRRKYQRVSGRKNSPSGPGKSKFHSKFGQIKLRLGDKGSAHTITEQYELGRLVGIPQRRGI